MTKNIQHIGIVGSGNVANHLAKGFKEQGINIQWISSRNQNTGEQLAQMIDCEYCQNVPKESVDLILLCVNDDEIYPLIASIDNPSPIAYTSGTKALQIDLSKEIGVFYPLQTFTKDREVNLFEVPFFIEATDTHFAQSLFDLAWKLSRKVQFANSEDRLHLHLAAVILNNFTNHLVHLSQKYLQEHQLDWEYLKPLLKETVNKLMNESPYDAQTGPARRNDTETVNRHINLLEEPLKSIYSSISQSITESYTNEKL